jgi:hypothetical protein
MLQFFRGYAAFLDIRYWFNPNPVPLGPTLVGGIFFFFIWFIVAAVAFFIAAKLLRKKDELKTDICRRFTSLLWTTGSLGLLFLFFGYEQIPFLGMRFWFLLDFILFVIWLVRIAVFIVRDYPAKRAAMLERERMEQYLPHAKKR